MTNLSEALFASLMLQRRSRDDERHNGLSDDLRAARERHRKRS